MKFTEYFHSTRNRPDRAFISLDWIQRVIQAMKVQYFPDTDTLYIELCPDAVCETRDWDENTLLDLDEAGRLCAITIEHASQRIAIPDFAHEQIPA